MNTLAFRIKSRLAEPGLKQTELAKEVNVKPQTINAIIRGKTRESRKIVDIAKVLKRSPEWLNNGSNVIQSGEVSCVKIPIISYMQAENFAESPVIKGNLAYILTLITASSVAFALRIYDDSMEPNFKEGDIIVIVPTLTASPGEFVVASSGNHEVKFNKFKQYGTTAEGVNDFELMPLNNANVSVAQHVIGNNKSPYISASTILTPGNPQVTKKGDFIDEN